MSARRFDLRALRAQKARRGDSLIEVMAALVLATVGLVGIASLQGTTAKSNQDSQETSVAVGFARTWLQRIRRDALGWTAPGVPNRGVLLANRNLATPGSASYFVPQGGWGSPVPLDALESSGANIRGVDVGVPDPLRRLATLAVPGPVLGNEIHYCVNTRFVTSQLENNLPVKMLGEVRVWWTRRASLNSTNYTNGIQLARTAGSCDGIVPDLTLPELRVLYLSTPLRYTVPSI